MKNVIEIKLMVKVDDDTFELIEESLSDDETEVDAGIAAGIAAVESAIDETVIPMLGNDEDVISRVRKMKFVDASMTCHKRVRIRRKFRQLIKAFMN